MPTHNYTISHLTLNGIIYGPFFSKNYLKCSFFSNYFKHFVHPFIYSNTENQLQIFNSKFKSFLSSAIILHKEKIFQSLFQNRTELYNDTKIYGCSFLNLNVDTDGGGIYTDFSVKVVNSLFSHICSKTGGGISGQSSIKLYFCTFCDIRSEKGSAFFMNNQKLIYPFTNVLAKLHQCLLFDLHSEFFPAFYINSATNLSIKFTNFTYNRANNCVGCFEANVWNTNISYSIFDNCECKIHNGGIVLRQSDKIFVSKSIFHKMIQHSDIEASASSLLIYSCNSYCKIFYSNFYNCQVGQGHTINFISGGPVLLLRCQFSHNKKIEINHIPKQILDCQSKYELGFINKDNLDKDMQFIQKITIGFNSNFDSYEEISDLSLQKFNNSISSDKQRQFFYVNISLLFDYQNAIISFLCSFIITMIIDHCLLTLSRKRRRNHNEE